MTEPSNKILYSRILKCCSELPRIQSSEFTTVSTREVSRQRRQWLMLGCLWPLISLAETPSFLSNTLFTAVGKNKSIDPYLLYAIALAESGYTNGGTQSVQPWPFTLRTQNRAFYGKNLKQTSEELMRILRYTNRIDVGLMQVNLRWHSHRVRSPMDLLDARTNLEVAADILAERIKANHGDLNKAIGQYHSFSAVRGSWYAAFVLSIYKNLPFSSV